MKKKGRKEGK